MSAAVSPDSPGMVLNWFYLSSIFLISAHPDIPLCMSTLWYSGVASPAMAYVVEGLSPVHVDLVSASPEVTVSHDVEVEVLETVPVETVLIDDRIEISEVGFEEGLLPPFAHPEGKLFVSLAVLLRCFFFSCGLTSCFFFAYIGLTVQEVRQQLIALMSLRATTVLGALPLDLSLLEGIPPGAFSARLRVMMREQVEPCREYIWSVTDSLLVGDHE